MSSRQSPRLAAQGRGSSTSSGAMRRKRAAPRKGPMSRNEVVQLIKKNAGETKYFDTGINVSIAAAGGDWASTEVTCDNYIDSNGAAAAYTDCCLLPTANGSAYGQVVGNRYYLKKIRVRGHLQTAVLSDSADAASPRKARLMLVMDTQPNGQQAQGEDIMQDVGAAQENEYSFKRVSAESSRFRILKDEFLECVPTNSQTDGANTGSIAYSRPQFSFQYQPRKPIQVNVKSGNATPTIAGTVNCNVFMILYAPDFATSIVASSRCYYQDS